MSGDRGAIAARRTLRAAARSPGCARSRSSSSRRRWRSSRSATSSPPRCCRPAASRHDDAVYVWGILAGSAVGLLASTLGRLYSSTYYALRDTRTPLRYALVRVVLTTVLGYLFAIPLPRCARHRRASWGAAGLTASAGIAGWVEMLLLRARLNARIGRTGLPAPYVAKLWASAVAAAAAAWVAKLALPPLHPIVTAILVLGPYGIVFFGATLALRRRRGVGRDRARAAAVALRGACRTAEIAENAEFSNQE